MTTVLIHLLIYWLTPPDSFFKVGEEAALNNPSYEIALVPPEPEEMRFVHTNPDVAQNEPDTDRNFAARNQQAAQEVPDPKSRDDLPTLDGEEEESTQIVRGTLEDPIPPMPPPVPQQNRSEEPADSPSESQQAQDAARPEIRSIPEERPTPPAPEFLEQKPESEEGPGSTTSPIGDSREIPEETPDRVIPITAPLPVEIEPLEGEIQRPADREPTGTGNRGDDGQPSPEASPSPRPRPRLDPFAVPAPLMQSNQAASRQGQVAVDAKFSEYGEYLQRLVEAVSRAWNASVSRVELIRERPSRVRVRFTLNSRGQVSNLRIVDKTPNAQLLATGLCMDAIQSRSPYDQWTEHMVQNLGTEQEITFTFHYY